MNLKRLLDEKKIEEVEKQEYNDSSAIKDLEAAKDNLQDENYDWSIVISYSAVLRTMRSYIQSLGFRTIGKEHHKNCFEFLRETEFNKDLLYYFDNIRKKRNSFVYRDVVEENKEGAEETILKAESFVQEMRTFVQKNRTIKSEAMDIK